jgi:hypothetical protein
MFFGSDFFWLLMGVVLVLIAAAFKAFAEDQGWKMTWWKYLVTGIWYWMLLINFSVYGILTGEGEGGAGIKILLLGLFVLAILAVGLWRLILWSPAAGKADA